MKKLFFIILLAVSFSSCMMMMPGNMTGTMQKNYNHVSSDVKIDRVCGKQVGEGNSFSYEYQGNIYYFDTELCLSVFKSNPDHFLQKPDKDIHKKTWIGIGWIGGGVIMTALMILMLTNVF